MKHLRFPNGLMVVIAFGLMTEGFVQAADCPENSPEDAKVRRKLAKEWFATAEAADAEKNHPEAIRAYACSYKMIAHPNTAYNLARVANLGGEYELSLKMYKAYLALKPDAPEKNEVTDAITVLEGKIKDLAALAAEPEPTEPPKIVVPAPSPPPRPTATEFDESHAKGSYKWEWVIGGASAFALASGIVLNISARNKMSDCERLTNEGQKQTALGLCNDAPSRAYASYALFGVAAVGAAVDAVLIWRKLSPSRGEETTFSFNWVPGGGTLVARGRY